MNIRILLIGASFTLLLATSNANAQEQITPSDLKEFGWEYVGETVKMYALLNGFYACRQPSNKGQVCTYTEHKGRTYDDAIFAKGIKSRKIKPLIGKCVLMIGDILDADVQTLGAMTSVPALIIEDFEIADASFCP
jgi:hypothetical protein